MTHLFAYIVCSIWPIDRTLSGATTLGQNGLGSNGNKGVLHIPQISKAGAMLLDCLESYVGHLLVGILTLCRDAVSVFYTSSRLGQRDKEVHAFVKSGSLNVNIIAQLAFKLSMMSQSSRLTTTPRRFPLCYNENLMNS